MNNANIAELEAHGYKYIIGAKIRNESQGQSWMLGLSATARWLNMTKAARTSSLGHGFYDDRAKKDAYNREKGIRRLEKAYKHGAPLQRQYLNKRKRLQ